MDFYFKHQLKSSSTTPETHDNPKNDEKTNWETSRSPTRWAPPITSYKESERKTYKWPELNGYTEGYSISPLFCGVKYLTYNWFSGAHRFYDSYLLYYHGGLDVPSLEMEHQLVCIFRSSNWIISQQKWRVIIRYVWNQTYWQLPYSLRVTELFKCCNSCSTCNGQFAADWERILSFEQTTSQEWRNTV